MKPKVLLVTTCHWFTTARIVMALAKAECQVSLLCPTGHPAGLTRVIHQRFPYRALSPLRSLTTALEESQPDIVIPCDDLATEHLLSLSKNPSESAQVSDNFRQLINRTLGDPTFYTEAFTRYGLMCIARDLGVRVPVTGVVTSSADITQWAERHPFPAVMKADCTWGGTGVRVVHNVAAATRAFRYLRRPPPLVKAMKRALLDRDLTLVMPSLLRKQRRVSIQSFVDGRDANISIACWEGRVLASVSAEVLHTSTQSGPASVVRLIDNPEMLSAAESIIKRLKFSGFCGFDFMLERSTGHAYMIEMNPRATQLCHLPLGTGRDLTAALRASLADEPVIELPCVTHRDTIALFPQEWQRSPESEHLQSAYHDVPWDEPEFLQACLKRDLRDRLRKHPWLTSLPKPQKT